MLRMVPPELNDETALEQQFNCCPNICGPNIMG